MEGQVSRDKGARAARTDLLGGPRSAGTREAILRAARAQFAANGYERATIRSVALEAKIDPAMVMRYYQSKQGLFAAASNIDLKLPNLHDVPRSRLGVTIVTHFLNRWEGELVDDALLFLFRAAPTNDIAAARLQATFLEQVAAPIASVLDTPDAERRCGLVGSQLMGVALCRYILRLEPIASMKTDALIADLSPTLQRYLTGRLATAPRASSNALAAGSSTSSGAKGSSSGPDRLAPGLDGEPSECPRIRALSDLGADGCAAPPALRL